MNILGNKIKELLKEKGISQRELAQKTGCTEAAISLYIKGERNPRAKVLNNIALALNTSSEYLLNGIPENVQEELGYAKKLIARNVNQMSAKEKKEIIDILIGDDN